ncbi:MAG TPA: Ni/Fe hydrogenase subunit alpha [Kineosporiaceae bacterium]|nr:Ni/Fe hydrogenase subunit alpha [Kineosporiaceae bacterium]
MSPLKSGSHLLEVGELARVEGEGAMRVVVLDGEVTLVELRITEPPRYFEGFLRGRAWTETPDLTSRICGICPVAYQLTAVQAIEDACAVALPDELRRLRRLLYCGEWIESHALHIYLLHAPDFLGYDGAIEMAADHRGLVERGLRLKKAGNAILTTIGGRAIHPVNARVGGFHQLPTPADLRRLRPDLERGRDDALATVALVGGFDFPDFEQPHEYLCLRGPDGYPLESGSVVTSSGGAFAVQEFTEHVHEEHVARSHALHSRLDGDTVYAVGPLARYTLCSGQLSPLALEAAREAGLGAVCRNPFRSIVVRAVELVYAFDEALRLIDSWQGAPVAAVPVRPRFGEGHGATEAPRGLLYHRYRIDTDGTVLDARIIPPTAQNQASIEADLRAFVQPRLHLSHAELTHDCEQAIRNYDPCISCATHFLDLRLDTR